VFVAALIVQAGLWGVTFIDAMSRRFLERQGDPRSMASAISLVRVLSRTVLWSIVLLSILRTMGIDVTAMIAGLGIGGIAIGLAAQGIFADLFGSLAIVFDKPFDQGDYITFGDTAGTIEHVGVKSTRIRALTGEQVVLSNSALLQHTIRNFQRLQERRVLFSLGVTYQTPHEKVGAIPGMVRDAIARAGCTRFDRCHFKEFGDSALLFEVAYYVLTADFHTHMDTRQAINLEIMRRFAEQGIEFAYPTQTLFLERAGV
ncbi:MAG TPA: mechanosensitive ion channel family protein, partial [Rhizomicrobium sp.]|nr:mechanosensitive ion channel family protein [Rhizomicrobium sp.]